MCCLNFLQFRTVWTQVLEYSYASVLYGMFSRCLTWVSLAWLEVWEVSQFKHFSYLTFTKNIKVSGKRPRSWELFFHWDCSCKWKDYWCRFLFSGVFSLASFISFCVEVWLHYGQKMALSMPCPEKVTISGVYLWFSPRHEKKFLANASSKMMYFNKKSFSLRESAFSGIKKKKRKRKIFAGMILTSL